MERLFRTLLNKIYFSILCLIESAIPNNSSNSKRIRHTHTETKVFLYTRSTSLKNNPIENLLNAVIEMATIELLLFSR